MISDSYSGIITALAIWREARGSSDAAKRAILHVILNRARAGFRGHDPLSVILFPYQFSSFSAKDPNAVRLPDPKNLADWRAWLACCAEVDAAGDDPTGGAMFYHSYPAGSELWPGWATVDKLTLQVEVFRFYRL